MAAPGMGLEIHIVIQFRFDDNEPRIISLLTFELFPLAILGRPSTHERGASNRRAPPFLPLLWRIKTLLQTPKSGHLVDQKTHRRPPAFSSDYREGSDPTQSLLGPTKSKNRGRAQRKTELRSKRALAPPLAGE